MTRLNEHTVAKLENKNNHVLPVPQAKFGLKRTGEDLTDHEGIAWIYLDCPHCLTHSRFTPQHTTIVDWSVDEIGLLQRELHSLAVCENCGDVIYIKCFEVDDDRDWWFDYEYHYPQQTIKIPEKNLILPNSIYECFL